MAKTKAKVNEKTLDVLSKTKKPARRGTKKSEATPTQPKPTRSRSRSRTPSRTAKAETIIVPKTEPKKSVGRKPKSVNNSVGQSKSEPIVKRLDGEVKRTRAAALKSAIPKNSTPKKKPQEIATPTRKQPRRIAAINSGNSHSSHKMEVDDVDSVVSPGFNHDEAEEVNTGGGGWFSRCCIV